MLKIMQNTEIRADLLERVMETGADLLGADAGSLLLLDSDSERLHFMVATGEKKDQLTRFILKPGQGIAGHVVMEGRSMVVNDAAGDGRWYRRISESIGVKTQSIACAPLQLNGLTVGVVEFIHNGDGKIFQPEELKILQSISEMAAFAVKKACCLPELPHLRVPVTDVTPNRKRIIGKSPLLLEAVAMAEKAAPTDSGILITGESGVGKELMARLVHEKSKRHGRPLININCAAIPDTLLESELFGHEKGSFTGASYRSVGKFELADGGTLFLDEIGEMTPNMQKKLLRVLQEGKFYRIGGTQEKSVDVRVVAATNRNVLREVQNGEFRRDLYYRLNVVPVHIPPLRKRTEDIPEILDHFLGELSVRMGLVQPSVTKKAKQRLMQYHWPGNIRELKNMVERALILDSDGILDSDDFHMPEDRVSLAEISIQGLGFKEAVDSFKAHYLEDALRSVKGSRVEAAKRLKLQRTYLSRLLKKHGVT